MLAQRRDTTWRRKSVTETLHSLNRALVRADGVLIQLASLVDQFVGRDGIISVSVGFGATRRQVVEMKELLREAKETCLDVWDASTRLSGLLTTEERALLSDYPPSLRQAIDDLLKATTYGRFLDQARQIVPQIERLVAAIGLPYGVEPFRPRSPVSIFR